jgi:UTP-glucose-1-phosphate uridylyltransferase/transcriptional regulator with XRE-family HTH domain
VETEPNPEITSPGASYGKLLQTAREALRLSRKDLGDRAGYDGSHIYRIEKELRNPPPRSQVAFIAQALGLDIRSAQEHLVAAGYDPLHEDEVRSYQKGLPRIQHTSIRGSDNFSLATQRESSSTQQGRVAASREVPTGNESSSWWQTVLRPLESTLRSLPPEMEGPAIGLLSSINATLAAAARIGATTNVPESYTGFFSRAREVTGVEVACLPLAGRQWREPNWEHVVSRSLDIVVSEVVAAQIHRLVIVLPEGDDRRRFVEKRLRADPQARNLDLSFPVQHRPQGLGHAVLSARAYLGNTRSVAVILPDDRFYTPTGRDTVLQQIIMASALLADGASSSMVAVARLPDAAKHYGMARLDTAPEAFGVFKADCFAEKPTSEADPVFLYGREATRCIVGRYLIQPATLLGLHQKFYDPKRLAPLDLTDGLQWLVDNDQNVYAYELSLGEDLRYFPEAGSGKDDGLQPALFPENAPAS